MTQAAGEARARKLFAVLEEAGNAMGFQVFLKLLSFRYGRGNCRRSGPSRTSGSALDASHGRLIVFERAGDGRCAGPFALRTSWSRIGAPRHVAHDYGLSSTGVVRDVLDSVFGGLRNLAPTVPPGDRLLVPTAVSVLATGTVRGRSRRIDPVALRERVSERGRRPPLRCLRRLRDRQRRACSQRA